MSILNRLVLYGGIVGGWLMLALIVKVWRASSVNYIWWVLWGD